MRKRSDPNKLRNAEEFRPITLCNVDYKIFDNISSNRPQFALSKFVGDYQTYRGSSIWRDVLVARCLLQSCADLSQPVALVHVGLAKAHDRVNSNFFFILLDHGSVGQVITERVQPCYRTSAPRFIVDGTLTFSYRPLMTDSHWVLSATGLSHVTTLVRSLFGARFHACLKLHPCTRIPGTYRRS